MVCPMLSLSRRWCCHSQRASGLQVALCRILLLLACQWLPAQGQRYTGLSSSQALARNPGLEGYSHRTLLDQAPSAAPACETSGNVVKATNGVEFFNALQTQSVQYICIIADMELLQGPALGLWGNLIADIVLTRNLTIYGALGHGQYPVISFNWRDPVKLGVRLGLYVNLIFARVTIKNVARGYIPDMITAADITGFIYMYDCIHHAYAGGPPGVVSQIASHSNRPSWTSTLENIVVFLPKGFCRSGPAPALCWVESYLAVDMADKLSAATSILVPDASPRLPVKLYMYGVAVVYEDAVEGLCLQKFYSGNLSCLQELSEELAAKAARQPNGWVTPTASPDQVQSVMANLVGVPLVPDVAVIPPWLRIPGGFMGLSPNAPGSTSSSSGGGGDSGQSVPTIPVAVAGSIGGIAMLLFGLFVYWYSEKSQKTRAAKEAAEAAIRMQDLKTADPDALQRGQAGGSSSSSREHDPSMEPITVNGGQGKGREGEAGKAGPTGDSGSPGYGLYPTTEPSRAASGLPSGSGNDMAGSSAGVSNIYTDTISQHSHVDADPSLFRLKEVITGASPVVPSINLQVDMDRDVVLGQKIGTGAMGSVYQGTYRDIPVAVKLFAPGADLTSFAHEISILGRTNHPNVVALLGACFSTNNIALVEELCDGSLEQLMYSAPRKSQGKGPDSNELSPDDANLLPPGTAAAVAAAAGSKRDASAGLEPEPGSSFWIGHRLPEVPKPLPLGTVLSIVLEVACGLAYLHPTVIHRDLKPANILLVSKAVPSAFYGGGPVSSTNTTVPSQDGKAADTAAAATGANGSGSSSSGTDMSHLNFPYLQVKLSDFGLSRMRDAMTIFTQRPYCGTVPYMAPECFNKQWQNGLTHKCDIYSFGIVLWELLHGLRPWYGYAPAEVLYEVAVKNTRPPILVPEERCPGQLRKLLTRCWDRDPHRRPPALEIIRELAFLQRHLGLQRPRTYTYTPHIPPSVHCLTPAQLQQASRESAQFMDAIQMQINARQAQVASALGKGGKRDGEAKQEEGGAEGKGGEDGREAEGELKEGSVGAGGGSVDAAAEAGKSGGSVDAAAEAGSAAEAGIVAAHPDANGHTPGDTPADGGAATPST